MALEEIIVDDEIAHNIMMELEKTQSKDLADSLYAKVILDKMDEISSGAECEIGKRAVVKVLLVSTWTQRMYFIIRSFIMGQIGALITLLYIGYFGTINLTHGFIMGIMVFIGSLFISRLFDQYIMKGTKRILSYSNGHKGFMGIIMKYF
jgi:hypothetical protein